MATDTMERNLGFNDDINRVIKQSNRILVRGHYSRYFKSGISYISYWI